MIISFQVKAIAAALAMALIFGSGWQVRTWFDGAQQTARLEAEAANRKLMGELANKVSAITETAIQGIRIENRTIYNATQKEILRDTVYRDCVVPAAGILLVNKARGGSAGGKPDSSVPADANP